MPEAKQNKRLLIPEELGIHFSTDPVGRTTEELVMDVTRRIMSALKAQDAKTLKEVGEWLVDKDILEINDGVQYLLRGEMPDAK
ncbi:unnamed protein product [marine sediment metagenome]|uniref:Uncharacterized protein n=1 Tax=marine sediment metagenome TaxID=412755 RepID=X1JSI8_9ZZZZ